MIVQATETKKKIQQPLSVFKKDFIRLISITMMLDVFRRGTTTHRCRMVSGAEWGLTTQPFFTSQKSNSRA